MIKSKYDQRKYKVYTLKNKLEVMLISDKITEKSSVSMNIGVGCFQDPEMLPGLAHFLEHMLFMGTKKYPDENDFSNYLSKNGGIHNAFTSPDTTNYHLEINSDGFKGALDRFAHFFIDPLFNKGSIDRELNAINSEHSKNLQNDIRRIISILRVLSKKDHPSYKFCTGNLETLRDIPKKKGVNIYDEVLKFYNKWYSANIMKLVVLDKEPLDKMEKMVSKLFDQIKNFNVVVQKNKINPYNEERLRVYSIPINNIDKLEIYWSLDSKDEKYFRSSLYFIYEMLDYKGSDSFFSLLKSMGLIYDLSFGYLNYNNLSYYLGYISLNLTKKGLHNINKISELIYQFINYVKGMDKDILEERFRDLNDIAALNFMFKSKEDSLNYTIQISQNMDVYEKKYYLVGDILMRKFKYPLVIDILNNMLQQISINLVLSKDLLDVDKCESLTPTISGKKDDFIKEHYYGTEYKITKQKKYDLSISRKISDNITFPRKNKYIPTNFKIKQIKNRMKYPISLISDKSVEVWFKQDWKFKKPICFMFLQLINPITGSTADNFVLCSLFCNIINDVLIEKLNSAYMVGNVVKLYSAMEGINIFMYGYDDKFSDLIIDTFHEIITEPLKEHIYNTKKDSLIKYYTNKNYQSPISQGYMHIREIMINNIIYLKDKRKSVKELTFKKIVKFKKEFFRNLYLKFLIQGNVTTDEAKNHINSVRNSMNYKNIPAYPTYNIIKLENKRYIFETKSTNKKEVDSAIISLYQFGKMNFKLYLLVELLHTIIDESFFDILRTKEQLGYLVSSKIIYLDKIICLAFEIQSSVKDPRYLQSRIDNFLTEFRSKIVKMTDNQFESYIRSVMEIKKMKYINLEEEFDNNCTEIKINEYIFNRKSIDVNYLKRLHKKHIIKFYDRFIKTNKRNIIIHIHGTSSKNENLMPLSENVTLIKSIKEFKIKSHVYS